MLLVGANGAIGTRYRHVLNYLDIPFVSFDANYVKNPLKHETVITHRRLEEFTEQPALICTPTHLHFKHVKKMVDMGYSDFLVEKPVFSEAHEYTEALGWAGVSIHSVMNYKLLDSPGAIGPTRYMNFHAGKERPEWNLFQIVALARSEIEINLECPVWTCYLNGKKITLEQINQSYLEQVKKYLHDRDHCVTLDEAEGYFYKVRKWFSQNWQSESKPDSAPVASQAKSFVHSGTEKQF
jgi:hypothetical protein